MSDSLEKALSLLPHGPEFRFLDRLISLEPGESATAEFTVRDEHPFLRGHFPGNPAYGVAEDAFSKLNPYEALASVPSQGLWQIFFLQLNKR